jgi:hypothetical protein
MFRLRQTFFVTAPEAVLNSNYNDLLEQQFILHYFGNWTWQDVESMPVDERIWQIKRLEKQKEKENKQLTK